MDASPGVEEQVNEMPAEVPIAVYEFAAALVKKAARMLMRAAHVRDDNPYIDKEVKGTFVCLKGTGVDGRGIGE